ncbi:MAG: RagB/SusD family nutrient uptake outer membrane protein [Gemmatimonadetes bacterium]|nr:RagB/SusD family nutrient uptake outer membrane protein [Gemmatimonadota bacterium]
MKTMIDAKCRWTAGAVALVVLALTSCDFDVTNPGPVQDTNLNDSGTHTGLVNGAMRGTLTGLSSMAHSGSAVAREFQPSGGTGAAGVSINIELGQLWDDNTAGTGWERTHKGRWVAEYAIGKVRETMGAQAESYAPLGQLYLWAGLASRSLGEHYCTAVFDAGPPQPNKDYFTRAIEHFKNAEKIAAAAGDNSTRDAAIGARAAAYASVGSWNEAAADAAKLAENFKFRAQYTGRGAPDLGTDGETWRLTLSMSGGYRSISFKYTQWEKYFTDSGDPRAAWGFDNRPGSAAVRNEFGEAPRPTFGSGSAAQVQFYYPLKYYLPRGANERTVFERTFATERALLPINLVSGREMILIRAEALLKQSNVTGALALINQIRQSYKNYFTGATMPAVTATTLEEAWAALKWERGLELLLEGRRFGDRARWLRDNTPGALHALEYIPDRHVTRYAGLPKIQDLCFPVPRSEKEANNTWSAADGLGLDWVDTGPDGKPVWTTLVSGRWQ